MNQPSLLIIDSGICNLFNVTQAFRSLGANVTISRSKKDILGAERVVLPGVGAFGSGMKSLAELDLTETLSQYTKSGKPLLGICLGMQLLMSTSEELGQWDGLNLIPGKVRIFQAPDSTGPKFKIPQIGWNFIERNQNEKSKDPWATTVLDGLEKPYMYFVHSFVVEPENEAHVLATTAYGKDRFCSVINKDNISGCQFHPERSGETGIKILNNFLKVKV